MKIKKDAPSETSRISSEEMDNIIDSLMLKANRSSTYKTYYSIWKSFNRFVIRLDVIPRTWEQRTSLYCAYLVNKGVKSSTLRSYVSAIKGVLKLMRYQWNDSEVILNALVRVCKFNNDQVSARLPISEKLLEMMLFELERVYLDQPYLEILYKTILAIRYYGLFRIGELTAPSNHTIKACNVHVAKNKQKILIVLHTSKTHGKESYLQKVRINGSQSYWETDKWNSKKGAQFFCPFTLTKQ